MSTICFFSLTIWQTTSVADDVECCKMLLQSEGTHSPAIRKLTGDGSQLSPFSGFAIGQVTPSLQRTIHIQDLANVEYRGSVFPLKSSSAPEFPVFPVGSAETPPAPFHVHLSLISLSVPSWCPHSLRYLLYLKAFPSKTPACKPPTQMFPQESV